MPENHPISSPWWWATFFKKFKNEKSLSRPDEVFQLYENNQNGNKISNLIIEDISHDFNKELKCRKLNYVCRFIIYNSKASLFVLHASFRRMTYVCKMCNSEITSRRGKFKHFHEGTICSRFVNNLIELNNFTKK